MTGRTLTVVSWSVTVVFVVAAAVFVFGSETPPQVIARLEFVVLAAAVLGIPLGIRLGTQDKFWT